MIGVVHQEHHSTNIAEYFSPPVFDLTPDEDEIAKTVLDAKTDLEALEILFSEDDFAENPYLEEVRQSVLSANKGGESCQK